ncbi:helix-turn-helix domain-containing protein [Nocardia alba]|uniref:AraC family transcriptional regulator n=1 Tax=Nocardia alba TaxID=225051 RepID=A0A4R1FHY4_9NOCA|nr:helix-turn-helix domain-containing protein [Nocardia alba]TCJ94377.1 AraC family transcriptional regulator [Nocardia alba]
MENAQACAGERESFAEWESLLSESYVPLMADPRDEGTFHGRIERSSQPGFELSTISASGQRIRRTRAGIAKTAGEFLLVSILTEGSGLLHQDGRVALVGPGDMVFYDTSRPYHWDLDGPWSQVVVQTPLEVLLQQLGPGASPLPTAVTVSSDSAGGVVAGFFRDLARIQQSSPGHATVLAVNGIKLLASAIRLAAAEIPSDQPAQALSREQVLAFMRTRCADPSLTIDDIARACLVSRRTLYRLFGDVEDGLSAVLRRMRVECARTLLTRDPGRATATVALASGFASERHFFRAFRLETGMTPGEFRMLASSALAV